MIFIGVIALFFSGSPYGGGGLATTATKGRKAVNYVGSLASVKNKNKERRKTISEDDDDAPRNVSLDRLEGSETYDNLISVSLVQKRSHNGPVYVSTGRPFP